IIRRKCASARPNCLICNSLYFQRLRDEERILKLCAGNPRTTWCIRFPSLRIHTEMAMRTKCVLPRTALRPPKARSWSRFEGDGDAGPVAGGEAGVHGF